jgi:hypothetical protein
MRPFVVLFAAIVVAAACEGFPTQLPPDVWIVQAVPLEGADTSKDCDVPETAGAYLEWGYNTHFDEDGEILTTEKPDSCWEYADGSTFDVDLRLKYGIDEHNDPQWYQLNLYGEPYECDNAADSAYYKKTLQFVYVEEAGDVAHFNTSDTIPAGAECAWLGVSYAADTFTTQYTNMDVTLKIFTKLSEEAPARGFFIMRAAEMRAQNLVTSRALAEGS